MTNVYSKRTPPVFDVGDRVRAIHEPELGHGTVLLEEWERVAAPPDRPNYGYLEAPMTLVEWDRPSKLSRHSPTRLRRLTVFDRLAQLAGGLADGG